MTKIYDVSVRRFRGRLRIEAIHPAVVVGQDSVSAEASDVYLAQAAT